MSYTIEEFLEESRQRAFSSIPPEILAKYVPHEILQYFPPEERLKGLSVAEIKAWLAKLEKEKS